MLFVIVALPVILPVTAFTVPVISTLASALRSPATFAVPSTTKSLPIYAFFLALNPPATFKDPVELLDASVVAEMFTTPLKSPVLALKIHL